MFILKDINGTICKLKQNICEEVDMQTNSAELYEERKKKEKKEKLKL